MRSKAKADFTTFVETRHAALFRTAYLLAGNYHDAEDLVQTALLKVCSRWPRIDKLDNPEAYVRKVMVNQWISWRRRRSATEIVSDELDPPPTVGPEEATGTRHDVWVALGRLARQQRAVIVLGYYEDLSTTEIADLLGIAPSTVKHHRRAALAALATTLGNDSLDLIQQGEA